MESDPLAIDASGVCRRYGRRWALAEVSLRVPRGTVVMVTGRNGSGKSTLLRVLATAIRADIGSARVFGFDCRQQREEVRRHVALLAHQSHLYEALTPLDNLAITTRFLPHPPPPGRLEALLEDVGLADRAADPVATFSAGMRKRLSLARVLLQDAPLLLLDEPHAQLDPPGFRLVDDLIARLRAAGRTVLMATHLLERGAAVCDQAIVLEQGRLAWSGPAAAVPQGAA
ncbi:MAG TPA: heme ABC exporter ATP-binding protein CcmA [Vicinamibacteria bacterium]|nr:heme ABC exporter ATP-binding protein CcmA [Vicinamibacteria bacterium]